MPRPASHSEIYCIVSGLLLSKGPWFESVVIVGGSAAEGLIL